MEGDRCVLGRWCVGLIISVFEMGVLTGISQTRSKSFWLFATSVCCSVSNQTLGLVDICYVIRSNRMGKVPDELRNHIFKIAMDGNLLNVRNIVIVSNYLCVGFESYL